MPSRNDITGDKLVTKTPSKKFLDSIEQMPIEQRRSNKGKYRWCKEQKKMISDAEWRAKYGSPKPRQKGPLIVCNHFDAFESPVTGNVINNKREHEYDLHSTGSRTYEGREQEEKEAAKWQAEQERDLERSIDHTLHETWHEIEHGYRNVE